MPQFRYYGARWGRRTRFLKKKSGLYNYDITIGMVERTQKESFYANLMSIASR